MKILFYRYKSICEPDLTAAFQKLGIEVVEMQAPSLYNACHPKEAPITMAQSLEQVNRCCRENMFLFVFSVNFFPELSDLCNIMQIPYVGWTVDAPVIELFSPSLSNPCNRIFLFDHAQYEFFKERNPGNIFYLPLASNVERMVKTIEENHNLGQVNFSADVSFVGSLYTEKNPYEKIQGMSDYTRGYVDGLMRAQSNIYGCNFLRESLNDTVMEEFLRLVPDLSNPLYKENLDPRYVMANDFISMQMAADERLRLLSVVSEEFALDLYTASNPFSLPKADFKGVADTFTEMPLIFHCSGINLNITLRAIQTGLSLRIFDVLACGGFLLTNYQSELPSMYELQNEVETFCSKEELLDKIRYYLAHDTERNKIAANGFRRTLQEHTWSHRLTKMIQILNQSL